MESNDARATFFAYVVCLYVCTYGDEILIITTEFADCRQRSRPHPVLSDKFLNHLEIDFE